MSKRGKNGNVKAESVPEVTETLVTEVAPEVTETETPVVEATPEVKMAELRYDAKDKIKPWKLTLDGKVLSERLELAWLLWGTFLKSAKLRKMGVNDLTLYLENGTVEVYNVERMLADKIERKEGQGSGTKIVTKKNGKRVRKPKLGFPKDVMLIGSDHLEGHTREAKILERKGNVYEVQLTSKDGISYTQEFDAKTLARINVNAPYHTWTIDKESLAS